MFYEFTVTVPITATQDDPVEQRMKLTKGVIHRVEVQFPIGTRALIHVQIYDDGHQIWPTNPDGNFNTDGYTIGWDEHYEITSGHHELRAVCWSTADTFPYDIDIRFAMLENTTALMLLRVIKGMSKMLKLMGIGA